MNYSKADLLSLYSDPLFYDEEFSSRNAEIPFYLAQCAGKNRVLEVACGTGRITIPLKQAGVNIVGCDISSDMIARARKNAERVGLNINFSVQDACETDGDFDLIFMATNALQHLLSSAQLSQFLNACYRSLGEEGSLIIDIQVPDLKKLSRPPQETQHYKEFYVEGSAIRAEIHGSYDNLSQIYAFSIDYFNGKKLIKQKHVAMRMYFPQEIQALILQSGFRIVDAVGDYDKNALANGAPKQIYWLKK